MFGAIPVKDYSLGGSRVQPRRAALGQSRGGSLNAFRECPHQDANLGRLRIQNRWPASKRKFPAHLVSELSGGFWGLQEGFRQTRHLIALAQDSFDRDKAR